MKIFIAWAAAVSLNFFPVPVIAQGVPQSVDIARVNVQRLPAGYRASKVIGSSVLNDANEFIGKVTICLSAATESRPLQFFQSAASWVSIAIWSGAVSKSKSYQRQDRLSRRHQRYT